MKDFWKIVILFVIGAVGGYLIALQFQPEPDKTALIAKHDAEKKEYEVEGKRHVVEIIRLQGVIDSLEAIPPEIEKQIVYLQAETDSIIALDSLNAIKEYRSGLTLLDIRPENTLTLTLREIGLGALTFRETYGLRLTVPNLRETISMKDQLISKQASLLGIKDNIISIDSSLIEAQILLLKEKDSFWRNRFIFYVGAGAGYDGTTLRPELQMGIGIRIVGNE